jgi:hypothetical protein
VKLLRYLDGEAIFWGAIYPNQPDEGTCMPAGMCNALYYKKTIGNNYVMPLPPVATDCGTRIGYFDTNKNLLAYRTDMANILY